MDQDAFRKTYREINECFCVYEKCILTNRCGCNQAERFCIAEREGVECRSEEAQEQCFNFLEALREKARFFLKTHGQGSPLPHRKALRLQVGGLRGLHCLRYPDEATPVIIGSVHGLLSSCLKRYDGIENLPYQQIIKQIAAYQEPRRTTRRLQKKMENEETDKDDD